MTPIPELLEAYTLTVYTIAFGLEKERTLNIGQAFGQVAILWAGADAVPAIVLC